MISNQEAQIFFSLQYYRRSVEDIKFHERTLHHYAHLYRNNLNSREYVVIIADLEVWDSFHVTTLPALIKKI